MDEDRLQALIDEILYEDGTMSLWQTQLFTLTTMLADKLNYDKKKELLLYLLKEFNLV